jgi:defect-in-organelle-trafficking protein DotC
MRKNHPLLTMIIIGLTIVIVSGCSSGDKKPKGPQSEIQGFDSSKDDHTDISHIRYSALQETATTTGAQSGLSWQSERINQFLEEDSRRLRNAFNFQALILDHNVLPPVISEGKNALNMANTETLRLADQVYRIESPPKFVTAAPSWREYLWMDYKKPEKPNSTLLPRNDKEREVWNEAVKKGWDEGVRQANQIFSANMGRLKRDYNGMVLYRILLAQNMVTPPFVAKTDLGITGDGNEIRINDQVLRITATSLLIPDGDEWRAVATPGVDGVWKTQGTKTLK